MDKPEIIKTINLTKIYGMGDIQVKALEDISLDIRASEFVAIMGPSGSGKSTMMNMLGCLDHPTSGQYFLAGEDVSQLNKIQLAKIRNKQIGFVFQSYNLLPRTTALENVMLPLELAGMRDARQRAEASLEQVGLTARAHHLPKHLSGGEQQRVALARAFVTQPKILFADEPTGNLDAATGAQVIELMLELNRAQGTTLILVTHDDKLAERCKRQLRLAAGMVVP